MRRFILLFAAFLAASCLFGQEKGIFKGSVKDQQTGEALIGANIILKMDRSFGTAADVNGNFTISLDRGTYIFEISYTGMKTDSVSFHIEAGQVETAAAAPFGKHYRAIE